MKRFLGSVVLLALSSSLAYAKNSQTVNIGETITVGAAQLAPGDYKVSWTGTGPEVQVTLSRYGKAVVTVPAKVVEQRNVTPSVSTHSQGGVTLLESIGLSDMSLVIESAPTTGQ
jgi:hypothetical protein